MNANMAMLVSLAGVGVAAIAFVGVVAPRHLTRFVSNWRVITGLPVTVALRIVLGAIFLMAAPDCRVPALVRVVGLLEFGAAALLLGLRARRLARFVEWWLQRSSTFVRSWCLAAFFFGIVLVYAGA